MPSPLKRNMLAPVRRHERAPSWMAAGLLQIASPALSSDSLVRQRMAVSFGIEFYHGLVDSAVEVIRTVEWLMCEVMPLQVAPESLGVVQLRRVFRQPLDREPVGALGKGGP